MENLNLDTVSPEATPDVTPRLADLARQALKAKELAKAATEAYETLRTQLLDMVADAEVDDGVRVLHLRRARKQVDHKAVYVAANVPQTIIDACTTTTEVHELKIEVAP